MSHFSWNNTVKKAPPVSPDYKTTLKYEEKRLGKLESAIFTYIEDNNVELISGDQVYYDGKNQSFWPFATILKKVLESTNKSFPICTVEKYVSVLKDLYLKQYNAKAAASNKNNNNLTEAQILDLVKSERLGFAKSMEQAKEFLTHILFKVSDTNSVKVVARKAYTVTDSSGQTYHREKEILLPGYKNLRDYEETLRNIFVKKDAKDKPETYWDVYSRSKAVLQASMVYNPQKELYWCDEYKHYYVNSYIEPEWKKEPDYFNLMERHKNDPITFSKLGNLLRSFLIHLFPDTAIRNEVLKWCAFSNTEKLQTYLTLIGPPGIGKNLLVEEFLGYYHGEDNLNFPKDVITKFNEKNCSSTLLFFDEKMMVNIEQYNEMKTFINKKLAFEEKGKAIHMAQNFANVVWSCNTKDTMSGMSRDDRRFKIVPVTSSTLIGAPILDANGTRISTFNSETIKNLAKSETAKKEFVLLMLFIREHAISNKDDMDDINTIKNNEARDSIFRESRSMEFTEIIDVLMNIHDDYNALTNKLGNPGMSQEQKDSLGTMYLDYIPLSKLIIAKDDFYTYRVPFEVVKKVIIAKAGKQKPMGFRAFNRHLSNMPDSVCKGFTRSGQARDIEIKLDFEPHRDFCENLKPMLLNHLMKKPIKFDAKKIVKEMEEEANKNDPFS